MKALIAKIKELYKNTIFLLTKTCGYVINLYKMVKHQAEETLKKLFSSSIRADLLSLLLNNPDEKFYVRELANLIRKNPSGVKRELDNLEKMGILFSHKVANLKYFQANKTSSVFSELKNLITKSLGLPGALRTIVKNAGSKTAFIYGPYAEGIDTGSVDLFMIGIASNNIGASLKELEEKYVRKINYTVIDETEYKQKKDNGDADLENLLSGKKIILIGKV